MDHYLDIRLRANAGIGKNELMATLFYKIHVWIARNANGRIALSFPDMNKTPGARLRVHGCESDLQAFSSGDWRRTVMLWIDLAQVCPVPADARHCMVARIQRKSAHNMRQRAMRRDGLTLEQAMVRIPDTATESLDLPYLYVQSASTGQRVRFFIKQSPAQPVAVKGAFSAYGLGKDGATVPWF